MKTNRMLIALFVLTDIGYHATLTLAADTNAIRDTYAFGVALAHADSAEVIAYLSRESELQDAGVQVGDEIVEMNGVRVVPRDVLVSGGMRSLVDTLVLVIRRPENGQTFLAVAGRTKVRNRVRANCTMLDRETGYLAPAAIDPDSLDRLQRVLDSLAMGNNGYGVTSDVIAERENEAARYMSTAYSASSASIAHSMRPESQEDLANYRAMRDGYIQDKYGWQMQNLRLDLRRGIADVAPEVIRFIRLYCKEHNIKLEREI